MRAILQAVALPSRSVKKNMEEAERQFQSEYFSCSYSQPFYVYVNLLLVLLPSSISFGCLSNPSRLLLFLLLSLFLFLFVDRRPGDIEGITDIFFEDFKNFPQVRELGEDSARFVREEMEKNLGRLPDGGTPRG